MGPMWEMYYNCTGCVLGRAPRTEETLPEFCYIKDPRSIMDFISAPWCEWLLVCNDVPEGIWGVTKLASEPRL